MPPAGDALTAALSLLLPLFLPPLLAPAGAGFACLSSPCAYGICMDDLNSSFTCYCIDGYTGSLCQTNWDDCWSAPCLNGGTCLDGVASFNCSCPDGFVGDLCEQDVNECFSNPCLNNGTCLDGPNGYACMCVPGYSGTRCEQDVAVCNTTSEARCDHGGECTEGPGMDFTCACTPGWTGLLCEEPINECESSPCQHGGVCVDLHASYACACLFGYTGRNCEVELEPCERNPCLNGALCLLEDTSPVCYCVPDFHGGRCQMQYDECRSGPGCRNGGTCIDGVDEFSCSCPPGLTGERCECLILTGGAVNCTYVALTTTSTSSTSTTTPTTTASTSSAPSTPEPTSLSTSWWSQTSPLTSTSTRDGKGMHFTERVWTETSPYPSTSASPSTTRQFTSLPPVETTPFVTESFTTAIRTGDFTETVQMSTTVGESSSSELPFTFPEDKFTSPVTETETMEESSTALSSTPEEQTSTTEPPTTERVSATTLEAGLSTKLAPQDEQTPGVATMTAEMETTFPSTELPDQTSEGPTKTDAMSAFTSPPTTQATSELEPSSTTQIPVTTGASVSTEEEDTTISDFLWTSPAPPLTGSLPTESDVNTTDTAILDCSDTPCLNGGTCVMSAEGAMCACPFGWEGMLCEERAQVTTAAFTGHSFLTHRLGAGPGRQGAQVALRARTLAPSGLLLHAVLAPDLYMSLFLEDGLLKFQFSCGVQTMVFSEVQHRVNNGFDLHIMATLEVLPVRGDLRACGAALHVNRSLAMSGEQQSLALVPDASGMLLYLGGLPRHLDHPPDAPLPQGITGCMHSLEVDGEPRRIYTDAVDGAEVSECAALACLSGPCHGGATCVEKGDHWSCLCPSGYVGLMCERSVCENNPCKFGATCVPYPGSGFLCLCPLGKHGLFCESDLEIAQPSFSPSAAGLSSFAAYSLPAAVEDSMELRFRFIPTTQDQVGLLMFLGQDGPHGATSDHLAISFIKGYVVLTWNLGSGTRRIFTPRPLIPRGRRPHSVRVGRAGATAWLVADNLGNVTGSSPGRLTQLNTQPILYLGGHDAVNFTGLPNDLPLHSGFAGCLLDVEVRAGRVSVTLERTRAAAGRGVGQCGTTLCHARACQHGGACLHHAATFNCLCADGWFGPVCAQRYNPCDSMRHNCSSGATCVPLAQGYECDCPLGRAGQFCEREEPVSDLLLSGRRSFVSLGPVDFQRSQACVALEVRPRAERGLLLHVGHPAPGAPFLALVVRSGLLEARVSTGGRNGVLTVRSREVLAQDEWHRVRVCRYGRRAFLWVDGSAHSGALRPAERLPPTGAPLFIGGAPDLSQLPIGAVAGAAVPLHGCVRGVAVNWRRIPLDAQHITAARNVEDCDGTACGGDVCLHGGSCWLDERGGAYCTCAAEYSGARCESQLSCTDMHCRNQGRCVSEPKGRPARCHCPAGWGGAFCQDEVLLGTPHFSGEGYLMLDPGRVERREPESRLLARNLREQWDLSFLFLNFSTTHANGVLLWTAQGDELVGVGVEEGRLKVAWGWHGAGVFVVQVPGPPVSDGAWHDVALSVGTNVSLWTDLGSVSTPAAMQRPIAVGGVMYLGGFPGNRSVGVETRGLFSTRFHGCVQQVSWDQHAAVTDFSGYRGENVGSCELFQP